jgi:hypothetical protein
VSRSKNEVKLPSHHVNTLISQVHFKDVRAGKRLSDVIEQTPLLKIMSHEQAARVYRTCFAENAGMNDEQRIQGASMLYGVVKDKVMFLKALSAKSIGEEEVEVCLCVCVYVCMYELCFSVPDMSVCVCMYVCMNYVLGGPECKEYWRCRY